MANIYDDVDELKLQMAAAQTAITALETAMTAAQTNITAAQDDITDLSAQVQTDITALETATAETDWADLTLSSGWSNPYSSDKAQYKKIGNRVLLRGLVNGTAAAGTLIATLPLGYRPTAFFGRFNCSLAQTDRVNLNVKSDGTITDYAKGTSVREFVSLYGIEFSLD